MNEHEHAMRRIIRKIFFDRYSDYAKYRMLEILPGALVWLTFFCAVLLSFLAPLWAVYFIIVFDLYWLVRILYLLVYLIISYRRYRTSISVDWLQRVAEHKGWERIIHCIFLPTAGEPIEVVRGTIETLLHSRYPKDRMFVVLAIEERKGRSAQEMAQQISREFAHSFFRFLVTVHPEKIPGEIIGKGSNLAWAGRRVKDIIDTELHVSYDEIIVSSFDIDTQVHPQYFSYLTYCYLTTPNPTHASYQPVPLYNNNLWESPALMRVAANSTTFWLMTEQVRPERLFTFSSHSMSFRALVDVDFWQNDIVTEDSRIFLQCFLRYDGAYRVVPMYIPVSMDTVKGKNLWRSLVNLYKQQRRWAYGVENFPYMAWYFSKNRLIPFLTKFRYLWNQLEGVYSWATAPILIFLLGRLPLMVGKERLAQSVVAFHAPNILQILMTIAMIGLIFSAVLSTILLPPRPKNEKKIKIPLMILQWVLFPLVMIVFGSIPATDAQTRLMLGRYLGFWVTEKQRS
jgi:hypothetical protein